DPDLFSLEINSKGDFGKWSYYNGKINWFDYCDVDKLSIIEVKAMPLELGVEDDVELFWLQPGSNFKKGLKILQICPHIVEMCNSVRDDRLIKIFVKHLYDNDVMDRILEIDSELVDKDSGINDEIGGKYAKNACVLSDANEDSDRDGSEESDYNYDGPDDFEYGSDDDDLDTKVAKFQKIQVAKMKNTKVGTANEGDTSQKVQAGTDTSSFNKRGSKTKIERPKGSRAKRSMEFGSKFRPRGIDDKEYEMLDETGWASEEDEADTVNYPVFRADRDLEYVDLKFDILFASFADFKLACVPGWQLLSAVSIDGDDSMYPIVWAVVEKECNQTWGWFMSQDFAVAADGGGCSVVAADARGTKMRAPSSPIAKSPTSTPDASSFMPNPSSHRSTQVDSPSKNTRSKKKAKNV
ncbi:hypothetical protein LINPERHAP1_LOCUS22442, partial [Linum perenne]